jgi:hypothetical protein
MLYSELSVTLPKFINSWGPYLELLFQKCVFCCELPIKLLIIDLFYSPCTNVLRLLTGVGNRRGDGILRGKWHKEARPLSHQDHSI